MMSSTASERAAFTVHEFAARWAISKEMVYKLGREGKLTLSKIGVRTVITATEDRRFADSLSGPNSPAAA